MFKDLHPKVNELGACIICSIGCIGIHSDGRKVGAISFILNKCVKIEKQNFKFNRLLKLVNGENQ